MRGGSGFDPDEEFVVGGWLTSTISIPCGVIWGKQVLLKFLKPFFDPFFYFPIANCHFGASIGYEIGFKS